MKEPTQEELIEGLRTALSWIGMLRRVSPESSRVVCGDEIADARLRELNTLAGLDVEPEALPPPPPAISRLGTPSDSEIERLINAADIERRRVEAEELARMLDPDTDVDMYPTRAVDARFDRSDTDA